MAWYDNYDDKCYYWKVRASEIETAIKVDKTLHHKRALNERKMQITKCMAKHEHETK